MLVGSRVTTSFMSSCRFAAALVNACWAAGLNVPRSASAPSTRTASRLPISSAYAASAEPIDGWASVPPVSWIAE